MDHRFPSADRAAHVPIGDIVLMAGALDGEPADFGTLVVPECWDDAQGRRVELPVVRVHARTPTPEPPVFLFEGGPGQTNIKPTVPAWLLDHHDVVMVGYRGVDGSVSLSSPELRAALTSPVDPLSSAGLAQMGAALDATAVRLHGEGVDLQQYDLLGVVDDMEAARRALGYERVNLSGASYGGALVYTYCVRHPARIHRAIMTEAAFPFNVGVAEPATVDLKLARLGELWKQSPRVTEAPDILATMRRVLTDLPAHWNGVPIIPGRVRLMVFLGLYTQQTTAQTLDAFVAAEAGDASGLAFMSVLWEHVVGWFNWGDMVAKTFATHVGPERDYEAEMSPPASIIGSPLALLAWGPYKYVQWRAKPLSERHRTAQTIDTETLLIYGSQESCPSEYAPAFTHGSWVTLEDLGHMDVTAVQPEAAAHLQRRFLLEGIADTSYYREAAAPVPSFVPAPSYQDQAKALLAGQR